MLLTTQLLELRPINIDDKVSIFEYRSDAQTNTYQGWIPKSIEDVEDFIAKVSPTPNIPDTWFQLVIIEKATQQIIGDLGIHFLNPENEQVEIGFTLRKEKQGKGFAAEALHEVISYLFKDLKKHRITASIDPANHSSIRLVEKLGFRKEAHFIESIYINGQWVDDMVFALLEKEWN
jgi:RimJ/RimL family protein N-acetyltransferase